MGYKKKAPKKYSRPARIEDYFKGMSTADKLNEIYQHSTPNELMQLMWRFADRIEIPYFDEGVCKSHELDLSIFQPVSLNGNSFQLNTKEFSKKCQELEQEKNKNSET